MYRTKHCRVRVKAKSDHKELNRSDYVDEEFHTSTSKGKVK